MSWNAYPGGGSNHNTSQYPGQGHHNQHQQQSQQQQQYGQPGGWQQPPPQQYGQPQYGAPPQQGFGGGGGGGGYGQQYDDRNQHRPAQGAYTGPPSGPPPPQMQYNSNGGGYQGGGYQPPQQQGFQQLSGHNRYGPPPGPAPRPIPQGSQHYGPQFQGNQGGQAQQPFFQYSQCNGKKKALLIGINYTGTSSQLNGCINDVKNLKAFLQSRYGYKEEDMVVLTDDSRDPRAIPTRANMIQAMQWLVQGAQPNDSLFFHYSGHGGLEEDRDGDEESGFDSVIYPLDHKTAGSLVDDDMWMIMVRPLPAGARLTALFDSCHSGSALDLPYIYSTKGVVKEPNLLAEAGQGLLGAGMSYMKGDMSGLLSGVMGTFKKVTSGVSGAAENAKKTKTSPADVISLSGCKDDQTSADTQEAGKATGAMSFALISALTAYPNVSFQQLLINVREELAGKYSQKPQLSSSHPMDVSLAWTC